MTYLLGRYVYMEASDPAKSRQTAILEMPFSPNGGERCLKFFYHMHGSSSMGSLAVYTKESGSKWPTRIWFESGSPEYCYTLFEYY